MFGKYDSIRDESCVPRFFPDYKEIPSDTTSQRWIDRVYPDGTHILQQLTKLGMLVSDGYGRGTTYQLSDCFGAETLQAGAETLQAGAETLQAGAETLQAGPQVDKSLKPKRMSREEMTKKIVEFCSEWRTAEDIAEFLQRNKRYISNEVLPKMGSMLQLQYPQVKHHPDQKYRRISKNE